MMTERRITLCARVSDRMQHPVGCGHIHTIPHTYTQEMNDNIEERINLQKALFEIEDSNIFNRSVPQCHGEGAAQRGG